ncbi:alkaline phosphatase family protein [Actinomadura yumaensis]|uniref:alkaline phosphatase family protein n=1 Tax=Actinomadura yumaensis TaxID=111807 RepID=UPI003612954E
MPCLLISPRARRGAVAHEVYDHTSVLKAIEWRWGLEPLSVRDAAARNLAEALDFENPPDLRAPRYTVPRPSTLGCLDTAHAHTGDDWHDLDAYARRRGFPADATADRTARRTGRGDSSPRPALFLASAFLRPVDLRPEREYPERETISIGDRSLPEDAFPFWSRTTPTSSSASAGAGTSPHVRRPNAPNAPFRRSEEHFPSSPPRRGSADSSLARTTRRTGAHRAAGRGIPPHHRPFHGRSRKDP